MDESVEGGGWLLFAGVMVLVAGTLHCVWGIAALAGDDSFSDDELLIGDLSTWGVLFLIAAFSIWAGGEFGRWIGIIGAGLGALGALLSIAGFPLWSVCVFFIEVLVVYGLAAYGGHRSRAT